MATTKKHPTAVNIVSPGDGVFAEQLNYGDSTGSVISVSDVIMRHIEDYNAKFIPNRIYSNSLTNPSGLTFRLNNGAYATINGRWLKVAGDTDITLSGDNTHYIYLQITDDGGSETTRIPESDTFALTSATSYTESQENLLLAKVVVSGGAVSTFTNYYDSYGSAHLRASAIKPVSSTITMFGGALESATPVAQYSSNYLTFFDDKYLSFGTDKDSKITFVSASSKLLWDLPSGDLEISGGTIKGVPNPTANDEVANKAYVDSNITAQDVDIAADTGTIAIDLDSETLTFTGGTGIDTSATGNAITIATHQDISTSATPSFAGIALTDALTTSSTIDGRDVASDGSKLDGIESGATADQTASEILTALKTVDGAGSGLDADLLDGQSSAYYATASHSHANDSYVAKYGIGSSSANFGSGNSGDESAILVNPGAYDRVKITSNYSVTIANSDASNNNFELKYSLNGGSSYVSVEAVTINNGGSHSFVWAVGSNAVNSAVGNDILVRIETNSTSWAETSSSNVNYDKAYQVYDW